MLANTIGRIGCRLTGLLLVGLGVLMLTIPATVQAEDCFAHSLLGLGCRGPKIGRNIDPLNPEVGMCEYDYNLAPCEYFPYCNNEYNETNACGYCVEGFSNPCLTEAPNLIWVDHCTESERQQHCPGETLCTKRNFANLCGLSPPYACPSLNVLKGTDCGGAYSRDAWYICGSDLWAKRYVHGQVGKSYMLSCDPPAPPVCTFNGQTKDILGPGPSAPGTPEPIAPNNPGKCGAAPAGETAACIAGDNAWRDECFAGLEIQDADGDGKVYPWDCDETDGTKYPGAPEVCGNGLDDNCNGLVDTCVCQARSIHPHRTVGVARRSV